MKKKKNAYIRIVRNKVSSLDVGFLNGFRADNLSIILTYNFIEFLPQNIFDKSSLYTVDLNFNKINKIDHLCSVCHIKYIYLEENPLNLIDRKKFLQFGEINLLTLLWISKILKINVILLSIIII